MNDTHAYESINPQLGHVFVQSPAFHHPTPRWAIGDVADLREHGDDV